MPEWVWVLLLWLVFADSLTVLSTNMLRPKLVAKLGEQLFLGVYSLVAFAIFVPLVMVYWGAIHSGPLLWQLRDVAGVPWLAVALAALGWALIVASLMRPPPMSVAARGTSASYGLTRITRHPLFTGLALWGLSHILLNGFLTDVVFFGGFALYGVLGAMHQDARMRTKRSDLKAFYAETSLLPFAAIATGRNRLVLGELPWLGLAIGVGVAILLYVLHPWMI